MEAQASGQDSGFSAWTGAGDQRLDPGLTHGPCLDLTLSSFCQKTGERKAFRETHPPLCVCVCVYLCMDVC